VVRYSDGCFRTRGVRTSDGTKDRFQFFAGSAVEVLVVATDGLWDCVPPTDVVRFYSDRCFSETRGEFYLSDYGMVVLVGGSGRLHPTWCASILTVL
jgi:hypothetical protein